MQQQHITFLCATDKEFPWDVHGAVNDILKNARHEKKASAEFITCGLIWVLIVFWWLDLSDTSEAL